MNSNYVLQHSGIAATMSVAALLTGLPVLTAEHKQFNPELPANDHQVLLKDSFISSSTSEVKFSYPSFDAMLEFGAVVGAFYDALAAKQRRLDPRMAAVLASSVRGLYEID